MRRKIHSIAVVPDKCAHVLCERRENVDAARVKIADVQHFGFVVIASEPMLEGHAIAAAARDDRYSHRA